MARRADTDFEVAAAALKELKESNFELKNLKVPQLQSLVRALKAGKGTGNKPESIQLLQDKFSGITKERFERLVTTVQRGVAQVSLAGTSQEALQPPQPLLLAVPAPSAAVVDGPLPLALSRPRRGGA
eukprot:767386-Prymnesium_polylepis.1